MKSRCHRRVLVSAAVGLLGGAAWVLVWAGEIDGADVAAVRPACVPQAADSPIDGPTPVRVLVLPLQALGDTAPDQGSVASTQIVAALATYFDEAVAPQVRTDLPVLVVDCAADVAASSDEALQVARRSGADLVVWGSVAERTESTVDVSYSVRVKDIVLGDDSHIVIAPQTAPKHFDLAVNVTPVRTPAKVRAITQQVDHLPELHGVRQHLFANVVEEMVGEVLARAGWGWAVAPLVAQVVARRPEVCADPQRDVTAYVAALVLAENSRLAGECVAAGTPTVDTTTALLGMLASSAILRGDRAGAARQAAGLPRDSWERWYIDESLALLAEPASATKFAPPPTPRSPLRTACTLRLRGERALRDGQMDAAGREFQAAHAALATRVDHPLRALLLRDLARTAEASAGRTARGRALPLLRDAYTMLRKTLGDDHTYVISTGRELQALDERLYDEERGRPHDSDPSTSPMFWPVPP